MLTMKRMYLALFGTLLSFYVAAQLPARTKDPRVLTGDQVFNYLGIPVGDIVGFKYVSGSWVQVPIQVDEKVEKDIVSGYGALADGTPFAPSANNPTILFYCDPNTNIGTDTDTLFDADDEITFMLKDMGEQFTGNAIPAGVVSGTGIQIHFTDSYAGGEGYLYLFRQNGSLQQGAGVSYVNYTSNVSTVTGWPAHLNGLNNENTTISTASYSWHIAAEWKSDELKIALGNNADILDRHKNFFANGTCARTENTFSDAENAYLTAKAGPIRVIRSVMGANSGPLTQRTHLFYENRIDIITDLRVHSIPSVYDAIDYSPAANGMTYTNNLNDTTVTIDGSGINDDLSVSGILRWEQVKGAQGTLSWLHSKETNIDPTFDNTTFSAYYDDNSASPANNCTGDGQAWGTSGWGAVFGSVTTDPIGDAGDADLRYLKATRIAYIDGPTASDTAALYYAELQFNPAGGAIAPYVEDLPIAATITANPNPVLCNGNETTTQVLVTASNGTPTYQWSHSTTETGPTVLLTAGTYSVTVKDNIDSLVLSITIIEPAPIDTSVSVSINNLTATANAEGEYAWINCSNMQQIPDAVQQSYTTLEPGSYAVIITNSNGCADTSGCVTLGSITSISNEPGDGMGINLYPNPTKGDVILDVKSGSDISNYEVLDVYGKLITTAEVQNPATIIPMHTYAQGIYIIKLKDGKKGVKSMRLIKE